MYARAYLVVLNNLVTTWYHSQTKKLDDMHIIPTSPLCWLKLFKPEFGLCESCICIQENIMYIAVNLFVKLLIKYRPAPHYVNLCMLHFMI